MHRHKNFNMSHISHDKQSIIVEIIVEIREAVIKAVNVSYTQIHAHLQEQVNGDPRHEQAEHMRHIGAKTESPQSRARLPNEMASA